MKTQKKRSIVQYDNIVTANMYKFGVYIVVFLFFSLNISNAQDSGTVTDSRDGHKYKWIKVKEQIWMAENLAYLPKVEHPSKGTLEKDKNIDHYYVYGYLGESVPEAKGTINYKIYGALYNWKAAKESCPDGWHLPSDEEYMILEKNLGMPVNELKEHYYRMGGNLGEKLKSKTVWQENGNGQDEVYFNALPGGFRHSGDPLDSKNNGGFGKSKTEAYFWTSTLYTLEKGGIAYRRQLSSSSKGIVRFPIMIESGYSVRCVKD